jgi:predicted dinucleotide-binding enzyme
MKLGFIGAGAVAMAIGRYGIALGHQAVFVSRSLEGAAKAVAMLGPGASMGTIAEVAESDLVLLAVPWPNVAEALAVVPNWSGRILVDATNPFDQVTPTLVLADLKGRSASEIVAAQAQGARVVKAFNSITMHHFKQGPKRGDARRLLLVSGDDPDAKRVVSSLIEAFGFRVVDMGDLATGGRLSQAGGALATGADLLLAD